MKSIIINAIVITAALGALVWIGGRFVHLGRVEYTDNAQIRRNIIPINSRVQGFIDDIFRGQSVLCPCRSHRR